MGFWTKITKLLPHFTPLFIILAPIFFNLLAQKLIFVNSQLDYKIVIIIHIVIYLCCFFIVLIISLHIPSGQKGKYNIRILFVTNNMLKDAEIIKHVIFKQYQHFTLYNDNISVRHTNIICRYFFNYWCLDYPYLSKFKKSLLFLSSKLSRSNLLFFGQIEPIIKNNKEHKIIYINTYIPPSKNRSCLIDDINALTNKFEICYEASNEYNGLQYIVEAIEMYTKLFMSFDCDGYNEKVLEFIINYLNNNESGSKHFDSKIKNIILEFIINFSYNKNSNSTTKLIIEACNSFENLYGADNDITITKQYFSILLLQKNDTPIAIYKQNVKNMLRCLNKLSGPNNNTVDILANKAYLNLLSNNYDLSLDLYNRLFELPNDMTRATIAEIYKYFRDVEESSYEYEYATFAYAYYNLKKNNSPTSNEIAMKKFKFLAEQATDGYIIKKSNEFLNELEGNKKSEE